MFNLGIEGWLLERLVFDSVWNWMVNLVGGLGRNMEVDIVNEFFNKEFKGWKKNIFEKIKFKKVLVVLLICIIFFILDFFGDVGGNIIDEIVVRYS